MWVSAVCLIPLPFGVDSSDVLADTCVPGVVRFYLSHRRRYPIKGTNPNPGAPLREPRRYLLAPKELADRRVVVRVDKLGDGPDFLVQNSNHYCQNKINRLINYISYIDLMPSRRSLLKNTAVGVTTVVGGSNLNGLVTKSLRSETASTEWRDDNDNEPDLYNWNSIQDGKLIIEYLDGYIGTAKHTLTALKWVQQHVQESFPHKLSDPAIVNLCPSKEIMSREFGGRRNPISLVGRSGGRILMLDPAYSGPCGHHFTRLEEPLHNPFVQTLVHEYSHVPFYNKLYDQEGWSDPPRWLSQGIGDYIAENYRPNYITAVDEAVANENWNFEEQPYFWGLFLAEYMFETHSPAGVASLIENNAETFSQAMADTFGVTYPTFQENAKEYLREQFSGDVSPHRQSELGECGPDADTGSRSLRFDINNDGSVDIFDVQAFFKNII